VERDRAAIDERRDVLMPYKNLEDRRRNDRKKRAADPERFREQSRKWRRENPDADRLLRLRERANLYSNPERLAKVTALMKRKRLETRVQVLEMYGSVCACCGEYRPEFLAVDHVNNDGTAQRKCHGGGYRYTKWLLSEKRDGFQVLCHNCNSAKGFYGYCPHENSPLGFSPVVRKGRPRMDK
jgi:hypothetical protein